MFRLEDLVGVLLGYELPRVGDASSPLGPVVSFMTGIADISQKHYPSVLGPCQAALRRQFSWFGSSEFIIALSELSVATRDESTSSATRLFVSRWLESQIRISKYGDSYPVRAMHGEIFFFPDGAKNVQKFFPNRRTSRLA